MSALDRRITALESQTMVDDAPYIRIIVKTHQTEQQALAKWMIENNATQEPENIIYRVIVSINDR